MSLMLRVWLVVATASVVAFGCSAELRPQIVDPTYEDACAYTDCSGSGECVVGDAGAPVCLCEVGYQNDTCSRCEVGFHRDATDRCVADRRCADQPTDPCAPAGICRDVDRVITCECDPGYAGPRCNLCAPGYLRDPQLGCVLSACPYDAGDPTDTLDADVMRDGGTLDASDVPCREGDTQMLDFAPQTGWPSESNTCFSSPVLSAQETVLRSQEGDTAVHLCADSTLNGFATRHVELTAAPMRAAEVRFSHPVVSVSFDYASRLQPLSLSVWADATQVGVIDLPATSHASMTLELRPPARTLSFLSRSVYSQAVSLDNISSRTGVCP